MNTFVVWRWCTRHNKHKMITYYLPGKFILLDIKHCVFDRFVHECLNTADEEVDCTQQCLSVFG